jgi:hypothetical protein
MSRLRLTSIEKLLAAIVLLVVVFISGLYAGLVVSAPSSKLWGEGKVYVDSWDQGFVSASGTWVMAPDQLFYPMNVSAIKCFRDQKTCYDAQATISQYGFLQSDLTTFPIVRWDSSTIQFGETTTCFNSIYEIDRATETLSGRETAKPGCPLRGARNESLSFRDSRKWWMGTTSAAPKSDRLGTAP